MFKCCLGRIYKFALAVFGIKPFVLVTLSGGLGNQMLQYYAARFLSERVLGEATLLVDTSRLGLRSKKITLRKFELECFDLDLVFINYPCAKVLTLLAKVIGVSVKNLNLYNEAFEYRRTKPLYHINYHCADINVDTSVFHRIFQWKLDMISSKLSTEVRRIKSLNNPIAVFLRYDDWIIHDKSALVNVECMLKSFSEAEKQNDIVLFQIGKNSNELSGCDFMLEYIDDCDNDWRSYEKMYLMSKCYKVYTSKSTYGRCSMYLTSKGLGEVVDPC